MSKRKRRMMRFPLPKSKDGKEFTVGSFVMKELDGLDEIDAAVHADMRANKKSGMSESMARERMESARAALVAVDDEAVGTEETGPYNEIYNWSAPTLVFLNRAYGTMNGVDQEEIEDFDKGATVVESLGSVLKPQEG